MLSEIDLVKRKQAVERAADAMTVRLGWSVVADTHGWGVALAALAADTR